VSYFDHQYVSRSDLKRVSDKALGKSEPENLQQIFELGTLNHDALLESYKADRWLDSKKTELTGGELQKAINDFNTARAMAKTVLQDKLCARFLLWPDFRREFEWYCEEDEVFSASLGLQGTRCKTDGDSRELNTIFEYKGLALNSDKAFGEAILHHDYDMSAHWYLNVTGLKQYLIVGVSKSNPKLIFKRFIDRNHPYYYSGGIKTEKAVKTWKEFGFV
jgi:hypothetical protein